MRNTSWKDWFGAEVGFSIYIHRRGFTSSSTNSNQPSLLPLPRRVSAATGAPARLGSSHQHAGQAPPYRGHKAKFAPCETPPGRVGLVLKLDSLYIYIGGVSHHHAPSIINQCYLPPKARGRALGPRALGPRALGPRALGPRALGPRALGPRALGPRALGPRALGPRALGPRALGPRAFGPRALGPRALGLRALGLLALGPRALGLLALGPRVLGLRLAPTRLGPARLRPRLAPTPLAPAPCAHPPCAHAPYAHAPYAGGQCAHAPDAYASRAFAPTRWATPPYRCPSPPCRGVYPRDKGAAACAGRSGLLATVARAVESRHGASDNMRRPKPKPTRKPGPESRHSAIPSAWRSRRHSGATAGARGAAGRLAGELDRGIQNSI